MQYDNEINYCRPQLKGTSSNTTDYSQFILFLDFTDVPFLRGHWVGKLRWPMAPQPEQVGGFLFGVRRTAVSAEW